jgi:putative acetyltransferase
LGIRLERESDRPNIRALYLAAFGDHGNVVADLVDDLRSAVAKGEGLSLVAEERGEVVGHAMFTPSWLDTRRRLVDVQVLSPVGVEPDWQRRGIGSALIRHEHGHVCQFREERVDRVVEAERAVLDERHLDGQG